MRCNAALSFAVRAAETGQSGLVMRPIRAGALCPVFVILSVCKSSSENIDAIRLARADDVAQYLRESLRVGI
jgi:hypothetical protein